MRIGFVHFARVDGQTDTGVFETQLPVGFEEPPRVAFVVVLAPCHVDTHPEIAVPADEAEDAGIVLTQRPVHAWHDNGVGWLRPLDPELELARLVTGIGADFERRNHHNLGADHLGGVRAAKTEKEDKERR